jgi:hypothetical protein
VVRWNGQDRPVDRWGRLPEQVRADLELAEQALQVFRDFVSWIEGHVMFGREAGRRFWLRLAACADLLERVVERDKYFAEELEQAEAENEARRKS